ncbi:uncharacterized protein BT62DRAFT_1075791 [Guyanagaster necrorhizus]|uniref:Protein kinase domain-containing protein n=1 Tax=Guyanagaster necrorhizus TaxID=856835 RepID=A0A9P7VTD9_9AGAR|nr:uncharacterized protein BT62DRAFT_1075791 [Guyanagaster necrorhizus MCA 3950]KAG7447073.1 hypothetical protein BT62DRAFT_1075791 [Guyanagaster necrorhizus MCA 3950]
MPAVFGSCRYEFQHRKTLMIQAEVSGDYELLCKFLRIGLLTSELLGREKYWTPDIRQWSWASQTPLILDAVRMKDKAKVVLRVTRTDTDELAMPKQSFTTRRFIAGLNLSMHFVNFWRHEYLSPYNHPCSNFCLKGLNFMHSLNIAHTDVSLLDFLMDSSKVCLKGYHYADPTMYDGVHWSLPIRPRCHVAPENAEANRPFECSVKTSPQLSLGLPCNPFKLDVYNAGATSFELCETYHGLDDFRPLLLDIMSEDPFATPDMAEALRRLDELVSSKDKLWFRYRAWKFQRLVKPPSLSAQYLWRKFPLLFHWLSDPQTIGPLLFANVAVTKHQAQCIQTVLRPLRHPELAHRSHNQEALNIYRESPLLTLPLDIGTDESVEQARTSRRL